MLSIATLARADGFVRVDGARFLAGGKPFAFVGANVQVMHGRDFRARADETLAAARADALTVVRIWALGEGADDAPAWSRDNDLFRAGPDGWLDAGFQQLDRVLASARQHGLRVIVTLANYWDSYGGVPMYLRWAGLPQEGFGANDRFFSDEKTRALYRQHVERIVGRTNSVTGVRYADDPTIFAWELMNESRVDGPDGARARRAWIEEMAALLRARDPHHLITPGLIGYGTRRERAEWLDICRLPAVDYCDSHLYPQGSDEVPSGDELSAIIDDRVQLAAFVARKPIVFGEFGFDTRKDRDGWLGRPRAEWFDAFLGRVFFDGAAGALAWIYQPWNGHARDFGIYVDRPDTDDVRARMRGWASTVAQALPSVRNPLLGVERGERPLYDPYRVLHRPGPQLVTSEPGRVVVALDPEHFATGRFERVGTWDSGSVHHAYGAGDGWFEWRFAAPAEAARSLTVEARLSSEFPGESAPPDGTSRVRVSIDGHALGEVEVIPDDGHGRAVSLEVHDPTLLAGWAGRAHTLRLEVPDGQRANGVCVYAGGLRLTFEQSVAQLR